MAQEPGPLTQTEDTDDIRARIEETRAGLSQTIDAIQERLAPRHIAADVVQVLRDNAVPTMAGTALAAAAGQVLGRMDHRRTATWLLIGACAAVAFWSAISPPGWNETPYD
jgi:hypothetical protein